jgi:hypothetical protein
MNKHPHTHTHTHTYSQIFDNAALVVGTITSHGYEQASTHTHTHTYSQIFDNAALVVGTIASHGYEQASYPAENISLLRDQYIYHMYLKSKRLNPDDLLTDTSVKRYCMCLFIYVRVYIQVDTYVCVHISRVFEARTPEP